MMNRAFLCILALTVSCGKSDSKSAPADATPAAPRLAASAAAIITLPMQDPPERVQRGHLKHYADLPPWEWGVAIDHSATASTAA